jgi:hypothetical protein
VGIISLNPTITEGDHFPRRNSLSVSPKKKQGFGQSEGRPIMFLLWALKVHGPSDLFWAQA